VTPTPPIEAEGTKGAFSIHRRLAPLLAIPTPVIFVVGAIAAALLLWKGGALDDVGPSLRRVHPAAVLVILLAYAGSISILGARWHALTRAAGGDPPWAASGEVFLTSVIVNYAAPIGLAVPTRAALTVRDLGLLPAQSAAVVMWEALLDIATLAVISAVWIALGGFAALQSIALDTRVLLVAAIVVATIALAGVIIARLPRVRARLAPAARSIVSLPARSPRLALAAVALTALFWMLQMGVMAGLLRVFGAEVSLSLVLGVMGLPVLIGMLSPVPGGAGVREALMAAAAQLEGAPVGPVVLAAVAYRLALFIVTPAVWAVVRISRRQAR
jgi:uncharacterized membrane protein YbhN (UPF0104 family)